MPMEELTAEICYEYRDKAIALKSDNAEDIGERRKLREELQIRCGIPEIWALNIINGFYIKEYLAAITYEKSGTIDKQRRPDESEYLEWLEEKEVEQQIKEMVLRDELKR